MHRLVLEVRTQHLDSLVSKRIVELVDKLVQAGQPTAQAEPAAPTFQVGDKVVLNSGGPVMTVTSLVGYDGNLVCEWANGEETDHSCFPPAVLVRAGTVHNPIRP
ncbi:DUF2158 domain-containing protein [Massilia sp. CCM 8733]|uniref:DUF2158 domain-containing protein n=2 Tax=Massilia mucilaginosa TaxID=2609282 RepID=A0ABX0P2J1_9BURK|nr:DUF2158 domain-containing protein [Massilia mucilaginosa]